MGSYEREMALVEAGKAQRGKTALDYFAELDAKLDEEASHLSHRPDYGKTLFAPEHDDIYREFCAYVDLPEPRGRGVYGCRCLTHHEGRQSAYRRYRWRGGLQHARKAAHAARDRQEGPRFQTDMLSGWLRQV